MKFFLFPLLGFLFLLLAAIGVVLPVWPTTPFVLLSFGCFSGTPAIRERILKIRFFREYLESYSAGTGLRKRTVVLSLVYLWGMLILSMVLVPKLWLRILLPCIGTAVTIHILCLARPKPHSDLDSLTP